MIRELFGLAAFMHAFAQSVRGVCNINICSVFAFQYKVSVYEVTLLLYILKYTYLIFLVVPPILLFIIMKYDVNLKIRNGKVLHTTYPHLLVISLAAQLCAHFQ